MTKLRFRILTLICLVCSFTVIAGCQSLVSNFGNGKSDPNKQAPLNTTQSVAKKKPSKVTVKDESELCEETAKTLADGGHAREAILLFERAESLDKKGETHDVELASLYASSHTFDKAIARYERAIKQDSNPELWNNYAWTLMESGKNELAEQKVKHALGLFPGDSRLIATSAVISFWKGDRESAFRAFEKVLGTSPAYHNMAILDIEAGNAANAINSLELSIQTAKEQNPTTVELLKQLKKNIKKNVNP